MNPSKTLETRGDSQPWPLEQFGYGLKKRQKVASLRKALGEISEEKSCLLVTCGDNNGALNYHLKQAAGSWTWGEMEAETIPDMESFLEEPVDHVSAGRWPWADGEFDVVVSIDCLEHLDDESSFLRELHRVTRSGGEVLVTVPEGNGRRWLNRFRYAIGMTPDKYGHKRQGYTTADLKRLIAETGFEPVRSGGYSRLFTETIELAINSAYVLVLSRKKRSDGQIAPGSSGELEQHGAAYRMYKLAFPFLKAMASLDHLIPFYRHHAVWVLARKGPTCSRARASSPREKAEDRRPIHPG